MKKASLFITVFVAAGLLLWAFPFFSVALSAPTQNVDLIIGKSGYPDPVTAGNTLTYTLAITNTGDLAASGVVITDTLPGQVSFNSASPLCSFDGETSQVQCDLGSLEALASTWMTISLQVDPSARGNMTNTASANPLEADFDLSNNTVTETTTINASTDLSVSKGDGVSHVTAGDNVTYLYAITVTNEGPSLATGVVVTDTWPVSFTREVVSLHDGTCDTDTSPTDFTCDLGNILVGAQKIITVTYGVPSGTPAGTQTNIVEASSAEASVPVSAGHANAVLTSADLGIVKSDGISLVTAGDNVTYHYAITVTNGGPSLATGVVVTDTWPVGFTRGMVSLSDGFCDTATSPPDFTCNVGDIPVGGQQAITVTYSVPAGTPVGVYTNMAEANSVDATALITATDETNVATEADLSLSKLDDPDPVNAGETLTYTLTVNNAGPSDAAGVVISDTLPAGTTFNDAMSSPVCDVAGSIVTCNLGDVPAGDSSQVVIKVTVSLSTAGTITNRASIITATPDPDSGDIRVSVTTTVDTGIPVVTWVEPVPENTYYYVDCQPVSPPICPTVHLEASAYDDTGLLLGVEFYRWNHVNEAFIPIGFDTTPPYTWEFDTSVLPIGYNQIFTRAYDTSGHISLRKRIFLVKLAYIYLTVAKR